MSKKPTRGQQSDRIKRPVLQFRIREPIYRTLKKRAAAAGRSISAEAEATLEKAIANKFTVPQSAFDRHEWFPMKIAPKDGREIFLRLPLRDGDVIITGLWSDGKWKSRFSMPSQPKAWAHLDEFTRSTLPLRKLMD